MGVMKYSGVLTDYEAPHTTRAEALLAEDCNTWRRCEQHKSLARQRLLVLLLRAAGTGAGMLEDALRSYQAATQASPPYVPAFNNLGNLHLELGHVEEAERAYRTALALNPAELDVRLLVNLGVLLASSNRSAEAEACYNHAIASDPSDAEAYFNLGSLHMRERRLKEAQSAYTAALAQDPERASTHLQLGKLRILLGSQLKDASDLFLQAARLDPDNQEAQMYVKQLGFV
ncbi:hypothetical protein CYMTET_31740 [Cymbomonas tetramitiformis]|uniref:Uncharacterized protein n=1 Tax=Cymbomonas tetramitiformis TaxID=36881 RepID=A0AAE0FGG7_9CHLO|nr:hypothetical protein CYMTET_31740 [Cymbomonas tetramitiformis]